MTVLDKKKSPFKSTCTNTQFFYLTFFLLCVHFFLSPFLSLQTHLFQKGLTRKKIITSLYVHTKYVHNQSFEWFFRIMNTRTRKKTRVFYIDNPPTKHEKINPILSLFIIIIIIQKVQRKKMST